MTRDDIERTAREARELAHELAERVGDLENEREAIKNLPTAVAELHGAVTVLRELVLERIDGVSSKVDRLAKVEIILKYLVPLIIALIGGWFAIKAASLNHSPPTPIVRHK